MSEKRIAWNTGGGNIILTYVGEGNETVAVTSSENGGAARQQVIAVVTTNGAVTKNVTIKQAASSVPIGTIKNFAYTGAVQSIELPKGKYKLQCWGAQGGSNATYSSYGITAKAGGKGGYSEGVLTLTQKTTLFVFVGGKGASSGNGGWNGGGGGSGTSGSGSASGTQTLGYVKIGGGGGGTDIALVTSSMSYASYRTNRSSASLLSRIIVAGGGSGGASGATVSEIDKESLSSTFTLPFNVSTTPSATWRYGNLYTTYDVDSGIRNNTRCKLKLHSITATGRFVLVFRSSAGTWLSTLIVEQNTAFSVTYPSNASYVQVYFDASSASLGNVAIDLYVISKTQNVENDSHVGYAGGGVNGAGYSSSYYGKQDAGGANGGGFGVGACQIQTDQKSHGGCGGGGWYGGGLTYGTVKGLTQYSGGGSGFVNTAANAQYRPSGYTGLQLDSGTTTAGNTSFESTSGGKETGHSGNGYARITRIE